MIVNEELHGEFDEFRSKVYAYVDKEYTALLKLWNCFKFGVYAEFNCLEGDIF